ncbi:hypothetical protein AMTRI_Chr06g173770 [Amborella trichopoda]
MELVKATDGAYAHIEVLHDEVKGEERVEKVMRENWVENKFFFLGSTLYHIEDLPLDSKICLRIMVALERE